jgi:hypothetical protein
VVILDNDFRDPDVDRYLEEFEDFDPSVGVLGDAYTVEEARELNQVACELGETYPYKELVVVPKCREAFDIFEEDLVLGYPMGYSDLHADDYSDPLDWRGRRIHLLGASPVKQFDVIQELTQPTLTGDPPADIKGLDWNGVHRGAYVGEYWTPRGWKNADHLSIRETVQASLREIKGFWQEKGVWPETTPRELYGEAVRKPDELIYMDNGGDPIPSRKALEEAYVEEYRYSGEEATWAFQSEDYKKFVEWREDLTPTQS